MSTFPSIVPSGRLYITGDFPNSIQTSASGNTTGFRRGNRRSEEKLQLSFTSLTETQVNLIRTHFDDQSGSFKIFFLSSTTWSGYTNTPVPLISDVGWLYSTPPSITDSELLSRWDIEVELESVPINLGDLVFNAGDSTTTARAYILDALTSSASPARQNIIDSKGSAQP
tara:strand:- start:2733 stop:3242 length:510 start_codon:yes stop_codon:yes gene_type:complete